MNANVFGQSELFALAHEDLACYAIAQYPQFELAPHTELIIRKLESVERGEIRRLIVLLPPRHGKSVTGSSIFPAWYLGRHPDRQLIFASYGQEFSEVFGRSVRNFLMDPVHQTIFPNCRISEDSSAAHRFHTTAGGVYYAVGRGGPITGRGAHLLIVDDPLKDRAEANSETIRRALQEWVTAQCGLHSFDAERRGRIDSNSLARRRPRRLVIARTRQRKLGSSQPACTCRAGRKFSQRRRGFVA